MWRAMFSALGFMLCILGVEFLLVDEAVLATSFLGPRAAAHASHDWDYDGYDLSADDLLGTTASGQRNFVPPIWAPWSLLSSGAVVLLYALAMRAKGAG